jgi:hypothetical protein
LGRLGRLGRLSRCVHFHLCVSFVIANALVVVDTLLAFPVNPFDSYTGRTLSLLTITIDLETKLNYQVIGCERVLNPAVFAAISSPIRWRRSHILALREIDIMLSRHMHRG